MPRPSRSVHCFNHSREVAEIDPGSLPGHQQPLRCRVVIPITYTLRRSASTLSTATAIPHPPMIGDPRS